MFAEVIKNARERYPLTYSIQGRFTEKELELIEKKCDINVSSVYMNGECYYSFRFKPDTMSFLEAISVVRRSLGDEFVSAVLLKKALDIIPAYDLEVILNENPSYIQRNPIDGKAM